MSEQIGCWGRLKKIFYRQPATTSNSVNAQGAPEGRSPRLPLAQPSPSVVAEHNSGARNRKAKESGSSSSSAKAQCSAHTSVKAPVKNGFPVAEKPKPNSHYQKPKQNFIDQRSTVLCSENDSDDEDEPLLLRPKPSEYNTHAATAVASSSTPASAARLEEDDSAASKSLLITALPNPDQDLASPFSQGQSVRRRASFVTAKENAGQGVLASGRLHIKRLNKWQHYGSTHYCTGFPSSVGKHKNPKILLEDSKLTKGDKPATKDFPSLELHHSFYDCEAAMESEWMTEVLNYIPKVKKQSEVTEVLLAFYGTAGPCDGCKGRIKNMYKATLLALQAKIFHNIEGRFKAFVCFDTPPGWHVRGSIKDEDLSGSKRRNAELRADELQRQGLTKQNITEQISAEFPGAVATFYGYPGAPKKNPSHVEFGYQYDLKTSAYQLPASSHSAAESSSRPSSASHQYLPSSYSDHETKEESKSGKH